MQMHVPYLRFPMDCHEGIVFEMHIKVHIKVTP